jgi:hypothetical protein
MALIETAQTLIYWSMRCLARRCLIWVPCKLLGVRVDLLTPGDLPLKFRAKVLAEAEPV